MRPTGNYRCLTFEDRKKIEVWQLIGDRPADIAARLSAHYTTIDKKLQRGATGPGVRAVCLLPAAGPAQRKKARLVSAVKPGSP